MSLNNTLNAVISLVENKPDQARVYFRDPQSDIRNTSEAMARLYSAIDKHTAGELKELLVMSLSAQPDETNTSEEYQNGFFHGVRALEEIIESRIEKLDE